MSTIAAASASRDHVAAAIDAAVDGDTVLVPDHAGIDWTQGLPAIGKGVRLLTSAPGAVTIRHSAGSADLIPVTETPGASFELGGFRLLQGSGTGQHLVVSAAGDPDTGAPALIHDNYLETNGGMLRSVEMATNRGVIFRNRFHSQLQDDGAIGCKAPGLLSSWLTPHSMGTADLDGRSNLYIEDNYFDRVFLQALDFDDNSRVVLRHNTFDNSALTSHGADTSTHGCRHWEIYENDFLFADLGQLTLNLNYFFYVRGGSGVIFANRIPNIASQWWGDKSELTLTLQNLRRNAGPYACWNGGYPAPHQVGQGHDGASQTLEPVYLWGNTGAGNYDAPAIADYSPDECGGGPPVSGFIQSGRDFYVGTPRPGYAPYQYPHPLALGIPVPAPAPAPAPKPPPVQISISGVTATPTTPGKATVTWTTNVPASSAVAYGLGAVPDKATGISAGPRTSRSVVLTGLARHRTYSYQAISTDPTCGNEARSVILTFQSK